MINLFTTYYKDKSSEREKELIYCINKNIECKAIGKIYVLVENAELPIIGNSKVIVTPISVRPTYSDYFRIINEVSGKRDYNVIANADIYFDGHLDFLKRIYLKKICFALTRWDIKEDGSAILFDRNDSQDTWIFRGKIKNVNGDIFLGLPGCDNRIAWEIHKGGYKIFDPALTIKSYHYHLSDKHNYTDILNDPERVSRPYLLITPTVLKSNVIYFLKHALKKNDIEIIYS